MAARMRTLTDRPGKRTWPSAERATSSRCARNQIIRTIEMLWQFLMHEDGSWAIFLLMLGMLPRFGVAKT